MSIVLAVYWFHALFSHILSLGARYEPPSDPPANFSQPSSNGGSVKITLMGSRQAVDQMIHLLHKQNIVAGGEWSRPITIKNSYEVICVVNRTIATN